MSITQLFNAPRSDEILEDAIERQLRTSLSFRRAKDWHTRKSAFVSRHQASSSLCIKVLTPRESPPFPLPHPGDTLGVTFRLNHRKCLFGGKVYSIRQEDGHLLVTLGWPDHLQQVQRRAFERVVVPHGQVIAVRFWRDDEPSSADRNVRHGQLENLSAGGMCLKAAGCSETRAGDAYKCVFAPNPNAPSLILDARLQHCETAEQGRVLLGFRFVGLEATPEGRASLDRLAHFVSRFQHTQAKAARSAMGRPA